MSCFANSHNTSVSKEHSSDWMPVIIYSIIAQILKSGFYASMVPAFITDHDLEDFRGFKAHPVWTFIYIQMLPCLHWKIHTGLLLIHANDSFDKDKFYGYIKNIKIPNRRNPINVFVATNDSISRWKDMLLKVKTSYGNNFSFIYPSINESSKVTQNTLTINGMFSKYLFAQSTYTITRNYTGNQYEESHTQHIMFFFDEINTDSFRYAWSMFKYYQMQGVDKYVFCFYPQKQGDVDLVKESFISTLKSGSNPISESEAGKIDIAFIDNRNLSPIETGGVY